MTHRLHRPVWLAYLVCPVVLAVVTGGAASKEGTLLYTCDSTFLNALSEDATAEEIYDWVDRLRTHGGVDVYSHMVFHQGWVELFQSEFAEHDTRKKYQRLNPLFADGIQPLNLFIDRTHKHGMQFLANIRMNDRHGHNKKVLEARQAWILEEFPVGVDFSFSELRDWMFNIMAEIAEKFDVDGLELGFQRSCHMFPTATARESHPKMTELMRRVRKMLDRVSNEKGKKLQLGVRVPQSLQECRHLGLDVPTWIEEGLLDFIVPSDVYFTDFNAPYDEFSQLLKGTSCKMYPPIHPPVAEGYRQLNHTHMSRSMYRAAVKNFYMAGADGVSVFNYHYAWKAGWKPGRARDAMSWLREWKYPDNLESGERYYAFYPLRTSPINLKAETGLRRKERITIERNASKVSDHLELRIAEDFVAGTSGLMTFNAIGLLPTDEIKVELNGMEITASQIKRVFHSKGREASIHYRKIPPYSRCDFALTSPPAIRGKNSLRVTWIGPAAGADEGSIVIPEFEVRVHSVAADID